jgi:hypothetical protein
LRALREQSSEFVFFGEPDLIASHQIEQAAQIYKERCRHDRLDGNAVDETRNDFCPVSAGDMYRSLLGGPAAPHDLHATSMPQRDPHLQVIRTARQRGQPENSAPTRAFFRTPDNYLSSDPFSAAGFPAARPRSANRRQKWSESPCIRGGTPVATPETSEPRHDHSEPFHPFVAGSDRAIYDHASNSSEVSELADDNVRRFAKPEE